MKDIKFPLNKTATINKEQTSFGTYSGDVLLIKERIKTAARRSKNVVDDASLG